MIPIIVGIITFTTVFLSYKYEVVKKSNKRLIKLFLIAASLISLIWAASYLYSNFQKPHEWDFLSWYVYGSVAANDLNFYEPTSNQAVINTLSIPYSPTKDFIANIVNVGFMYTPPSMFIYLPLGYFSYSGAHILWVCFNVLCILFCLYLLWKIFLPSNSIVPICMVLFFFFLHKGTRWTLGVEQNTIILLLLILLIFKDLESKKVGLWIALGIIVKPIMMIFLGYLLIKKNWKGISIVFSALIILFGIAGLFFGWDVLGSFFSRNPNVDIPITNYVEIVNCSLLATILRFTNYDLNSHPPLFNPLFLIIGGIIFFVSLFIIYLNKNDNEKWVLVYLISLALLIYPATQQFYTILLMPLVFLLYNKSSQMPGKIIGASVIISLIYALPQLDSYRIDVYFIVHFIIWILLSAYLFGKTNIYFKFRTKLNMIG